MPKVKAPEVDSRWYAFAYLIQCEDELPADFPIPEFAKGFQLGVFLPRDPPDWFGRSNYPPRIVLLHGSSLLVLTHPRYGAEPVRLELADLTFYEAGHVLLIGWIRFATAAREIHLPYNTRAEQLMNEFLDSMMTVHLGGETNACRSRTAEFGPSLDIKFRNYLNAAMRSGELLCARWFHPPSQRTRRWGPFRIRSEVGGDVVALTNARLIWIRDQWDDHYERYGSITSIARLRGIERVQCFREGEMRTLIVGFHSGLSWRIPLVSGACEDAEAFASDFMSIRRTEVRRLDQE